MGSPRTTISPRTSLLAVLLIMAIPANLAAQISPGKPYSTAFQMFNQSWDVVDGERSYRLLQTTIPVGVFIPIADGAEATVTSSYVTMRREDSTRTSVQGLTDLKIQANFSAKRSRNVVFGLALNLPTGYKDLSNDEHKVLIDFIGPDLSVRQARLGEGLNVGATVSYAKPLGRSVIIGGALGYVRRGAFDTWEIDGSEQITLRPGDQATATLVMSQFKTDRQIQISPSVTFYGTELIDGQDVFQLGPKLQVQALYSRSFPGLSLTFSVIDAFRLPNKQLLKNPDGEEGNSLRVLENVTNTNLLTVASGLERRLGRRIAGRITAVGRWIGPATETNVYGHSKIWETGASLTYSARSSLKISLGGRYVSGSGVGWRRFDRNIQGAEGFCRVSYQFI